MSYRIFEAERKTSRNRVEEFMLSFPSKNIEKCKLSIIGFRCDINSSYMRGAVDSPSLIREAFFSEASNLWSESGIDLGQPNLFFDAGDVVEGPGEQMMGLNKCRRELR
jgi:arginase family enzyme